jgi:N-acetyltransferase 10
MGRLKLDNRIRTVIENGVANRHRSLFVVVGERARDQVPTLHHLLTKVTLGPRPSVLWCYKKQLGFSSHRQKRIKEIKKRKETGLHQCKVSFFLEYAAIIKNISLIFFIFYNIQNKMFRLI